MPNPSVVKEGVAREIREKLTRYKAENSAAMNLDPNLKQRWLEALRSGQYQQGNGYLRTEDDHFCCLGVACDLTRPEDWSDLTALGEADVEVYAHFDGSEEMPSEDVMYEWGMPYYVATQLASANDYGMTFEEIADLIEEFL